MKPLCQEGEYICFLEHDRAPSVYIVEKTEDLVLDYTFTGAVTTGTIGSFEQVDNVEPKQVSTAGPEMQCYQLRAGVDVGMIYTEMFAGTIRRTPYKQRRPTVATPYVGFFNQFLSPYGNPRFEMFIRFNERPSFAVYNNLAQTITPTMSFRGKKLRLFDMNDAAGTFKALPYRFANSTNCIAGLACSPYLFTILTSCSTVGN